MITAEGARTAKGREREVAQSSPGFPLPECYILLALDEDGIRSGWPMDLIREAIALSVLGELLLDGRMRYWQEEGRIRVHLMNDNPMGYAVCDCAMEMLGKEALWLSEAVSLLMSDSKLPTRAASALERTGLIWNKGSSGNSERQRNSEMRKFAGSSSTK